MKKGRGFLTIGLFALAATLLSFSVVGSSRAVLTYRSATYGAQVDVNDIGVTLLEAGELTDPGEADQISYRDYDEGRDFENEESNWNEYTGELVQTMFDQSTGELQLGHVYKEELSVQNTGNIDEYVRVTIYKYWEKNGEKQPDLDPDIAQTIKLNLINSDVWIRDTDSDTDERTVLYYRDILPAGSEPTVPFTDTLVIEDEPIEAAVSKQTVSETADGTVIKTEYDYNGATFVLEVKVDAVQTHNAADAIMSAWGVSGSGKGMNIAEG